MIKIIIKEKMLMMLLELDSVIVVILIIIMKNGDVLVINFDVYEWIHLLVIIVSGFIVMKIEMNLTEKEELKMEV